VKFERKFARPIVSERPFITLSEGIDAIFFVSFRQEMHQGLQQKEANQEMAWKSTCEKRHRKAE